jgi:hypothetical protein
VASTSPSYNVDLELELAIYKFGGIHRRFILCMTIIVRITTIK